MWGPCQGKVGISRAWVDFINTIYTVQDNLGRTPEKATQKHGVEYKMALHSAFNVYEIYTRSYFLNIIKSFTIIFNLCRERERERERK